MKTYKEILESNDLVKLSKSKFKDSVVATEFIETLTTLINSKALNLWAKETDKNFNTKTISLLKKSQKLFADFHEEMFTAGK